MTKREKSRIRIMHEAKRLYETYGIENVTFSQIAEEAGMCRTTIFNHFATAGDLMLALYRQEIEDIKAHCLATGQTGMHLIEALFGFAYRWEIYTPAAQRKYGYYTLPILRGDQLVGRIEPVCERKTRTLNVKNIWLEPNARSTPALTRGIEEAAQRLAELSGMTALNLSILK